jgi:hypothetical protein
MSRSFAHGTMGTCFALLEHARVSGGRIPVAVRRELDRLARRRRGRDPATDGFFGQSWCRGDSGEALLWVKAVELGAHPHALARARAAGRRLASSDGDSPPTLCCGDTGRAFALLALERIDPGNRWGARARSVASRAIGHDGLRIHPGGLAWGLPGLALFSVAAREGHGFPTLE